MPSSFGKAQAHASMQIKCTDAAPLAQEGARLSVSFAVGSLPPRQASSAHDFAAEPICGLPVAEAIWDLAAAAAAMATPAGPYGGSAAPAALALSRCILKA